MHKARAMLDALMGPGRDEAPKGPNKERFKDKAVCKGFLVGFCPFDKTALGGKRTMEVCGKIHSELMKEQFESAPDREAYRKECEIVCLRDCEFAIQCCEAHFNEERARIRDDIRRRKPPLPAEVNTRLAHMWRESSALREKAETLDDDASKEKEAMLAKAAELKTDIEEITKVETQKAIDSYPREEVCEICATAYTGEEDRKIHFTYKVHENYVKVREKAEELRKRKAEYDQIEEEERRQKRKDDGDKVLEKEGDKMKSRDRDRSMERDGAKDGRQDKDRDRGIDRGGRGRDRGRHRDRERNGRGRDELRGRGRPRSDSRDAGRGCAHGRGDSRDASRARAYGRGDSREASRVRGRGRGRGRGSSRDRSRSRGRRR